MKALSKRLGRLEERLGVVETDFTRQLKARLEAGLRRVAEWRASEGRPAGNPSESRPDLTGLTVEEIVNRGRQRAWEAATEAEASERYR